MALSALWNPNIQFLKTDGTINAGGKLVVTDHNDAESIPANYSDADGTTLNSSPIVLDALGRATCYIDDASTYDLYVKDANGATLWTVSEMTPGAETIVVRAGFSVSSNDSSVAVVISVDPNGVTNYDLSIQGEIDRAEGAEGALAEDIADEIDRAKTAEKAAKTVIVAGDSITVTKTVGADGQDVYTVSGEAGDNLVEDVRVNGASVVTDKVANIDVPVAGTASPLMDGTASAGASGKYAREDHVHPSDTSREAVANKTTVVQGSSDSKYPTDKAVWNFVNFSIATNTAYYISDNGEPFTSVEELEAYPGIVTNNDYAFVTGVDSAGNTYYDRYKATVRDSTVTWALEYRLNNSSFTAAQWAAINSGITSALVGKIHEHSNKAVLDGITATDVSNWSNKLDKNGDGSDVTVEFTEAANRTNIATGSKLSTLFGQIRKWFADLKLLAFKDKVGTGDVESGTYGIDISGTATDTSTGIISANADLNNYNTANRNYLCNATNASTVSNKPSNSSGAFELEVIRGTGDTCVQVYYGRDDVNFNYIRKRTGNGKWTGWVKLIDSSDVISPNYSAATLAYNASGESLLFNLSKVSVYGEIASTSYCQLKIVPNSGSVRADRSVIKSFNSNFDSFRIYNYPWSSSPGSNAYTPNITYNNNNIGTIDIDLVTTQTDVIHLTVWYIADTAAGLYRFYIVEEVKT